MSENKKSDKKSNGWFWSKKDTKKSSIWVSCKTRYQLKPSNDCTTAFIYFYLPNVVEFQFVLSSQSWPGNGCCTCFLQVCVCVCEYILVFDRKVKILYKQMKTFNNSKLYLYFDFNIDFDFL